MTRNQFALLLALLATAASVWRAFEIRQARRAISQLEESGVSDPYAAGVSAFQSGDYSVGTRGLLKLATLDNPHSADAWNNLGRVYLEIDSLPEAVEAFERALEEDPHDQWAGSNLGLAYLSSGQYREATFALEAQLQRDPYDPSGLTTLRFRFLVWGCGRAPSLSSRG